MNAREARMAAMGFFFGIRLTGYLSGDPVEGERIFECLLEIANRDLVLTPTDAEDLSQVPEDMVNLFVGVRRIDRKFQRELASKILATTKK